MKRIFPLSSLLLSCLLAQAQVKTDVSRVIVGAVSTISPELAAGLKQARHRVGNYQVALVSAKPFTSCYYTIYDLSGRIMDSGKVVMYKAGEVKYLNVDVLASECNVQLSEKPIAYGKTANNG
jgi:hypothetical protein